jgi:[acyl-carrier-protein] S-malonyltransferase
VTSGSSRLGFLFPGQGSQRVGMGGGLRGADSDRLRLRLSAAGERCGLDLQRICADGPMSALTRTEAAQPALFALSSTLVDIAAELGLSPRAVAGHSLGEYSAAVAAGALSVDEGVRLVCERGRVMGRAQAERPGAMAAVLGRSPEHVAELCTRVADGRTLAPANLNSDDQVVISGDVEAVDAFVARVAGGSEPGMRVVRLPVGAAFHSALMRPVRDHLAGTMAGIAWRDPAVPLIANATGAPAVTAQGVRDALLEQTTAPVQWVACVRALVASGCTTLVELGPGRVLSGLVRRIAPEVRVVAADTRAKLAALA